LPFENHTYRKQEKFPQKKMPFQAFSGKDLAMRAPFGCVVAGPSSSGKSTFVQQLVQEASYLINPPPASVLYCYGEFNSLVNEMQRFPHVQVNSGSPTMELLEQLPKPSLLILDDLLYSIEAKLLTELFTKKAHHLNLCIIFIVQDVFDKKVKVARLNSQYIVLTRAPSSILSIRNLGSQLFPGHLGFFLDAYRQATGKNYGYLFIDLHPASDPLLRLRSSVFKQPECPGKVAEYTTIFLQK
jgi:hypothetical protein